MKNIRKRRSDVGLALGAGRAAARLVGTNELWSVDLADELLLRGDASELTEALAALAASLAETGSGKRPGARRLHVALLSPLADLKVVELPRLSSDETRGVLASSPQRYFASARNGDVVGARRPGGGRRGAARTTPVLAATAPAAVVAAVHEAAAASGWEVDRVVPAGAAWAVDAADGWIAADLPGRVEAVRVARSQPIELRRFPAGTRPDDVATAVGGRARSLDPWLAAASGAARVVEPELVPGNVRDRRTRSERKRTAWIAGAAAALVIAAGAAHLWGLHHELALLRRAREAIRPRVEQVLAERETLTAAESRASAFHLAGVAAPEWSRVVADLSRALPHDAHLTALVAVRDSMTLDVVAASAAGAFEAVRAVPGVRTVRALAPVRREATPAGGIAEELQLAALFATATTEAAP